VEQWFSGANNRVTSSPAASDTTLVFSDGKPGESGRRLHCLSASSGDESWTMEIESFASGLGCLTENAVLAEVHVGSLTSFGLDGKVRWRERLGKGDNDEHNVQLVGAPAVEDSRIVVAITDTAIRGNGLRTRAAAMDAIWGWLLVLDEVEGSTLSRFPMAEEPTTGPIVRGKSILVGSIDGISAYNLLDGKRQWHATVGPVKSALVRCGSYVGATTSQGEIVVLDPATGRVFAKQNNVTPDIPPLPVRDALLVATRHGLKRFVPADQSIGSWLDIPTTEIANAVTSPLILSGSSVYFSGEGSCLVRAMGKAAP
jgi:outer membrane protein assembly factor BamB